MNLRALTTPVLMTAVLTACGGGGSGTPADSTTHSDPSISGITPDRIMYGQVSQFSVTGHGLDLGINFNAPGCNNVSAAAGGNETLHVYTCTPAVTGAMPITITAASGTQIASWTPTVPAPQVTFAISSNNVSMGNIVMELYPDKAPVTTANFLQYVNDKFYNNLIYHRVVPGFVIQGGGYDSNLQLAATRPPIKLEAQNGLSNVRGSVAMARTIDPNSATSQFYINTVDNTGLDTASGGYAVFGKVVSGMEEVVDVISAVPTQTVDSMQNVPMTPVVIASATQTK